MSKIPLIKPYMDDDIKQAVMAVLDSGYLTEGPVTRDLEQAVKDYTSAKRVIAVTSCTTGLEIALRSLNIGAGDEVIVPDYTYPATASVVSIVGATPVIVDIDPNTMLIDYADIEAAITDKTKAIIPVSLFGNPLDYNELNRIKKKHSLFIVEDAACSLGAEIDGIKVGKQADISVFSCHPRKFITTGEGGLIATDNDDLADWMESYKHFGISSSATREGTQFDIIGTNYKLSNILAAIGLGQMKRIDQLLNKRRALASHYEELLAGIDNIQIPHRIKNAKHSYQSFCIIVPERDELLNEIRAQGN